MSRSKTGKGVVTRLVLVYVAVVAFAIAIIAKVVYLQTVENEKWTNKNTVTQKVVAVEPSRGDICAADGRILATSVPYYEIRMDLKSPAITDKVFNKNIDSLSYCLSKLFGDKSAREYKKRLERARYRGDRYHLIKRRADYIQLKQLKTFPILRRGRYKGGIIVNQENRRIQPFVNLAVRTIGYYNNNNNAKVGLEGAFDKELRGEKGVRVVQKIAGNYWIPVNDENAVEPSDGNDIITTIDINVQDVAHHALEQQLEKHKASHGTAVLMEVETGDVKAIVNLKRDSRERYVEQYNYAIGERTEPGSTFKLPVLMTALEDGFIDLDDSVDTENGKVRYHDHIVHDSRVGGYGKITIQEAFELSSNVALSKIITQYYTKKESKFIRGLYNMSLNKRLGVPMKGERSPYIKFPEDTLWSGISLPQISYGYEVELTALQILTFYNAVANNGEMLQPRFVKAIASHGQIIKKFSPKVINPTICSRATIDKAKLMLEGVVERGTATNLKNSNYKIAGKTGTAQIANRKYGYKYKSQVSYQASFVGYFPADNPKYSCIVVVNAPTSGVYYGNLVAGQVFKEIADKVYSTSLDLHAKGIKAEGDDLKVPYSLNGDRGELEKLLSITGISCQNIGVVSNWVSTQKGDTAISLRDMKIAENLIPNVKGMGAKDALFLLENSGLIVKLQGRGAVVSQSLNPGSRYKNGDKIVLELES